MTLVLLTFLAILTLLQAGYHHASKDVSDLASMVMNVASSAKSVEVLVVVLSQASTLPTIFFCACLRGTLWCHESGCDETAYQAIFNVVPLRLCLVLEIRSIPYKGAYYTQEMGFLAAPSESHLANKSIVPTMIHPQY